jgi:MFS transporter, OFA family, oxalate/formate antiporter
LTDDDDAQTVPSMTQALALDYEQRPREGIYYGWVNVAVASLAMIATLPGRTLGLGLITEPLLANLKLGHVHYAWINFFATLIGSTFSLAAGPLLDRLGARIVLTANALLLGASVLAMSRVHSAATLALTVTLTRGLGQSALSAVALSVIGKWFVRRIHTAMAVFSAVVAIGFIAAIPGVQYAVERSGNWRAVWSAIGWTLLALAVIALLIVRSTPEALGLEVDGHAGLGAESDNPDPAPEPRSFTLPQSLRTAAFWWFALSAAVFNLVFSGVALFSESILKERGFYEAATFRAAMGVLAFGGLVANFVGGYLAGKWPLGRLMGIGMWMVTAALVILPVARSQSAVYLYALLMGVAGGVVTVVFFACWTKVFGRTHLGRIQGAAQVLTVLFSAAGPPLLALGQWYQGSYSKTFLLMAPAVAVLGIGTWIVRLPRRDLAVAG